jgi:hypothetical protein
MTGTVWAWGDNAAGQLGDGTTQRRTAPVPVTTLAQVSAMSAGNAHSLALVPAQARMTGTVLFVGQSELAPPQTVTFALRPAAGGATITRTVSITAEGDFLLTGVPRAQYSLAVKGAKWLQRVVAVDVSVSDASGVVVELLPGDLNDDNLIDLFDLILLFEAYGATPNEPHWNARADLNGDRSVTLFDLILFFQYYGLSGDP